MHICSCGRTGGALRRRTRTITHSRFTNRSIGPISRACPPATLMAGSGRVRWEAAGLGAEAETKTILASSPMPPPTPFGRVRNMPRQSHAGRLPGAAGVDRKRPHSPRGLPPLRLKREMLSRAFVNLTQTGGLRQASVRRWKSISLLLKPRLVKRKRGCRRSPVPVSDQAPMLASQFLRGARRGILRQPSGVRLTGSVRREVATRVEIQVQERSAAISFRIINCQTR